jgi:hypothetical protein
VTASTIIGIISAVLAIVRYLVQHAEQQKWMEAGAAQAALKGLQDADAAISKAREARQDARQRNAADPAIVLRDDDGFKRHD